jgi:hypothetical protein
MRQQEASASNTRTTLSLLAGMMLTPLARGAKMSMPLVMPISLCVTRLLRGHAQHTQGFSAG